MKENGCVSISAGCCCCFHYFFYCHWGWWTTTNFRYYNNICSWQQSWTNHIQCDRPVVSARDFSSARIEGTLTAPASSNWAVFLKTDGAARLFVDHHLVVPPEPKISSCAIQACYTLPFWLVGVQSESESNTSTT